MTTERIKEIQLKTPYPDSTAVQQALLQVWNEVAQEISNPVELPVIKKNAVKDLMMKSKTINKMFEKNFWDIHFIDVDIRLNSETIPEEAGWIKELWYLVK